MKTYHIITIGCQMNKSDSERLASALEQNGYEKTDDKKQADLVVVNTCGVRQTAEDRIYGLVPRLKKANKKAKIILTGCLVLREDVKKRLAKCVDEWLPISGIMNYARPNASGGRELGIRNKMPTINFGRRNDSYLKIKPKYQSKFSAFVPIGNGCNNFCSYCVVPLARGREVYRPTEEIVAEVESLVKQGYKEITLIAQNVNSFKSQILITNDQANSKSQIPNKYKIRNTKYKKVDFADLLKMVNDIKGDFWTKFSTSHPKDMSDKLIKTMAECEKACRYVHLPVQAGDDEVLSAMNRKYKATDYVKLVEKIRKRLNPSNHLASSALARRDRLLASSSARRSGRGRSGRGRSGPLIKGAIWKLPVSITTDIIVGFPGETKKQFNNTARLMKQIKFDMAYIACYSPRPGTAAFKLADNVPPEEKKRRELELMKILRKTALENNKKYLGKIVKALIEGKNKRNELFGSTETAKTVKILAGNDSDLIGKFANVKIIKARDFGLAGKIIYGGD